MDISGIKQDGSHYDRFNNQGAVFSQTLGLFIDSPGMVYRNWKECMGAGEGEVAVFDDRR